ncbi:MAG: DUF2058 family protein [Gammaproteobacteria bacterium]
MAKSLQEQLLEAGLVDKNRVQQANKARGKQARRKRGQGEAGKAAVTDENKAQAQAAEAEKRARDRELNREREERAARRALAAEIEQLVTANRADRVPGENAYQFVDDGKIKRVYVTEDLHAGLAAGRHAVVRLRRGYAVVERSVAERVAARDAAAVVALHEPGAGGDGEDDDYAQFEVPDDLQW